MSNLPLIKARLNRELCEAGHKCLPFNHCPAAAIKKNGEEIMIDEEKCIGCGKCVKVCKNQAIYLERIHLE